MKFNLPNLSKIGMELRSGLIKHSPELLIGFGIAGMLTTTVLAVVATPKALTLIKEKEEEKEVEKLEPLEVVKTTWTCYIPTTITCAASIVCILGARSIYSRRNVALAAAYSLSESALKTYQQKVIETIGEKKEKILVRDEIAKDQMKKNPVTNNEVIITGKGETLCYDSTSGRYFKSDIEKLRQIENMLNKEMISTMWISLNDYYFAIGLKPVEMGDDLGWNANRDLIDFDYSSQLAEDGTPCLVVGFRVAPRYDFRSLH